MALQIRQAVHSDKARWNQYIHSHPDASAYHNFAWVESVEKAYGHANVSLIALEDDKVVGVLPIIKMKLPLVADKLCSLPFCDIGQAVADSEHITTALLTQMQHLKEACGAKEIEYRDTARSPQSNTTDNSSLQGKKVRMILALPETSEQLMKGFKSKLRSQIHKAEKNGLTYKLGNNPDLLEAFYRVFIRNMRKLGSPVHSKAWYQTLRNNYQNDLLISVVYTGTTPIGAGIVLRNNGKACIPWASTISEYNQLAPNMLLYWSLLKEVTDLGTNEFDFGRSTYGEGTFKFKQQWGAQPIPLIWELPGHKSAPTEEVYTRAKTRKAIEDLWAKLPLALTTRLGPRIRKYISL